MEVYVEEVNKIKKNADAYSNLLGIEYYKYRARKPLPMKSVVG